MPLITRQEMEGLIAEDRGPRVSIYLPTSPEGMEFKQNPIRFKLQLQRAEQALGEHGVAAAHIEQLLARGRDLLADTHFWKHQGQGLAYLASIDGVRVLRLPLPVEEIAVAGDRFYLKPLLPLFGERARFWILAIEQGQVRLFLGSPHSVREVDLLDTPTSLRDALGYDWEQRSLQFHTGAGSDGAGRRNAMFHGHGEASDDRKDEIAGFFRIVDTAINRLLVDRQAPMVLAGVEYEQAIFRKISKYPNLVAEGIEGSPKTLSGQQLHERAWGLLEPRFLAGQHDAAVRFQEVHGTGLAGSTVDDVVPAAFDGRVDTIFVATDAHRWGRYDPETREIVKHAAGHAGDIDLLEIAALQSWIRGATVHAVGSAEVPGGGDLAAIYRY